MTNQEKAQHIANDLMLRHDAFSQWLGIEIVSIEEGSSVLQMTVRQEMTNGFGIAHGGITFSLADSAFAFACNSHDNKSVSLECSVSHTAPVHIGDTLTAVCIQENTTNKTGLYYVTITNQHGDKVALFRGTCYRTGKRWL
ncbi:MAG: hydroxyphenylacetyl-CoA thioesterase PaaI [Saprospiraceae bacterium]|nr:hydroxyphenylacetyl-CoA thioesterase PaaI [Saprospiraceae bacterium]MBP7679677.1 hydroxyphenylacetyl-CoA thioesterase PaaI [Saprospiraceae bacterium]